MLGMPNLIKSVLSSPFLKKLILPILPKICRNATKTNAVLKSKNSSARGRKIVDEPNPAIVPRISETKAEVKNKRIFSPNNSSTFLVYQIREFIPKIFDFFSF